MARRDAPLCYACVPGSAGDMCNPCVRFVRTLAFAQAQPGYVAADRPNRADFGPIQKLPDAADAPEPPTLRWSPA